MQREVKKYLYDVDRAASLIMEFCKDKSVEDYNADPMLRSAVERQFFASSETRKS